MVKKTKGKTNKSIPENKNSKYKTIMIYVMLIVLGIILGYLIAKPELCDLARDTRSGCYNGCEFSNLPNEDYQKCTMFCQELYGNNVERFCIS